MKWNKLTSLKLIIAISAVCVVQTGCRKDLLDQKATTVIPTAIFWQNEADAVSALMGVYSAARPIFSRDYNFDGQGEYVRSKTGGGYEPTGYGNQFDGMFRDLYGAINNANYVIDNVEVMKAANTKADPVELERIIGEARFLRALCYFRLISMWGDVPYIDKEIRTDAEVRNLSRTPITEVKDKILADLTFAADVLPSNVPATNFGRATKPAALAIRGKVHLYWASWKKNGWPELAGFQQNSAEATTSFTAAAADFDNVIKNFGLTLYLNGAPGNIDAIGKANILPNYYHLFTPKANGNSEAIFVFTHNSGLDSGQGDRLMWDFGTRSHEGAQSFMEPRYEIADRYQLITTGDFAPPLIPTSNTTTGRTLLNSAINPQSYANRDYRMKSTIMWDFEMSMTMDGLVEQGFKPWIFQSINSNVTIDGIQYRSITYEGLNSGYMFRKFLRNYAGQARNQGDFAWPVIRLADVFLMYAEATNEVNGPQADAIALVNRVRARGNLPALASSKTNNPINFFNAIEQERIVELVAEGQRSFDLRRWRAIERVWGAPGSAGVWRISTRGAQNTRYYQNSPIETYQRAYIFRIPQSEIERNPNLKQNEVWE